MTKVIVAIPVVALLVLLVVRVFGVNFNRPDDFAMRDAAELEAYVHPGQGLDVWQVLYVGYGRGPMLVVQVRRAGWTNGVAMELLVPEDGRFFDLYCRLVKGQYVIFWILRTAGTAPVRASAASDYLVPDDSPFRHAKKYQR